MARLIGVRHRVEVRDGTRLERGGWYAMVEHGDYGSGSVAEYPCADDNSSILDATHAAIGMALKNKAWEIMANS